MSHFWWFGCWIDGLKRPKNSWSESPSKRDLIIRIPPFRGLPWSLDVQANPQAQALRKNWTSHDMAFVCQVEQGADLLDINMDDGLIEGVGAMTRFVNLLVADPETSRVPFMIDSSKVSEPWLQNPSSIQRTDCWAVISSHCLVCKVLIMRLWSLIRLKLSSSQLFIYINIHQLFFCSRLAKSE